MAQRMSDEQRRQAFLDKGKLNEVTGCIEWQGSLNPTGYGQVRNGPRPTGRLVIASRLAYEWFVGPIPDGLFVCHKCDNRRCVNPEHLFVGDRKANAADMLSKWRHMHGEGHTGAKLDDESVRIIRELVAKGARRKHVAERFGVGRNTIDNVVNRKRWRHVP